MPRAGTRPPPGPAGCPDAGKTRDAALRFLPYPQWNRAAARAARGV